MSNAPLSYFQSNKNSGSGIRVHNIVGVCVGGVRMFMLSNEDTYMNFNLNTVDVPSNEDGPRSSDIGNDFNIT